MKKALIFTLAVISLSCFAVMASAQTAAPAAPTAATTTATKTSATKPPSAQQSRMKDCAAKYHQQNVPKDQYRSFMSTCLKNPATGTAATPVAATSAAAPTASKTK